jgi:A/G-specific adenine glycosylase
VSFACAANASGAAEAYPRRKARTARPERHGVAFRLRRGGDILLVRRADKGLLGGMTGLPTTPWREAVWSKAEALEHAPADVEWQESGAVRHVFTHFALTLAVWSGAGDAEGDWHAVADVAALGLPTVFRKALLVL